MPETNVPKPHSPLIRNFFFLSGIIATVLYRAIVILNHVKGPWAVVAWYVGTIGFILYFAHRYQIAGRRAKIIAERQLIEKVRASPIAPDDQKALQYVLGTLQSSKEKWNFITIFVTSGIALIAGVLLDFIFK